MTPNIGPFGHLGLSKSLLALTVDSQKDHID